MLAKILACFVGDMRNIASLDIFSTDNTTLRRILLFKIYIYVWVCATLCDANSVANR